MFYVVLGLLSILTFYIIALASKEESDNIVDKIAKNLDYVASGVGFGFMTFYAAKYITIWLG